MAWLKLTSAEGHDILINMANIVSIIPYQDVDGARAKLFSVATSALGDSTYTQAITVRDPVDMIAGKLKASVA